jgi:hypothetical protein
VTLLLSGAAVQRYGPRLEDEQELLAGLADLTIDLFAMESVVERAASADGTLHADLASLIVADRAASVEQRAKSLAARVAEGDEARTLVAGIRRLMRGDPIDRIALSRRIAAAVTERSGYPI